MLDLYEELTGAIAALAEGGIDYALCGGWAMAVHAFPRATIDIDLLIEPDSIDRAKKALRERGFTVDSDPMEFAGGKVIIHRLMKPDPESEDFLSVDLLLATPVFAPAWNDRRQVALGDTELWVVSREGLIAMKRIRSSGQDLDDIKNMEG